MVRSARIIPSDVIQIPAQEPVNDVDTFVGLAYKNRPDLAQARLQVDNAQLLLKGFEECCCCRGWIWWPVFKTMAWLGRQTPMSPSTSGLTATPDQALIGNYGSFLSQVFGYKYPDSRLA